MTNSTCDQCGKTISQEITGANAYICNNLGCERAICEECSISSQIYGLIKAVQHCIGIQCPRCNNLVHYNEV